MSNLNINPRFEIDGACDALNLLQIALDHVSTLRGERYRRIEYDIEELIFSGRIRLTGDPIDLGEGYFTVPASQAVMDTLRQSRLLGLIR